MDLQWIVKLIADGLVVPVVLIGAYALIKLVPNKEKYQVYSQVLMAGLTAYVAAKIIGSIYQPDQMRPFEILGVSAGASFLNNPGFPSDQRAIYNGNYFGGIFRSKELAAGCCLSGYDDSNMCRSSYCSGAYAA